ncbi:hypothetical protein GRF59_15115 [Paenibacillus sp. HJL G12]|uniref:Uncharacterized protein n=1 Tax=Paenibacillus dendrobii TaxID=2691084 RepID=A0A7X3IK72_9BACL|nr:hypothetical protein [Paenibacillus dendrobii]MWV44951.1 hypothetical protein [Paenibacillus dendrobii]
MNEPIKNGTSKRKQLEDWTMYFEYTRLGNKYNIEKVYKKPRHKLSRYGYISDIEELLLDLIIQERNGQAFLPKSSLFLLLNMVHDNYNFGRKHVPKLSLFTDISEKEIYEFYDLSRDSLTRSLENALNRLKEKSLVMWSYAMTVCIIDANVAINDSGKIKAVKDSYKKDKYGNRVYSFGISSSVRMTHREATKNEVQIILAAERDVMDELECHDKQEVVKKGLWDTFKSRVQAITFDNHNIYFYYNSYKIIFNEEHALNALQDIQDIDNFTLTDEEKMSRFLNVNNNIKSKLLENGKTRHNRAIKSKENYYRSVLTYIKNNKKLVNTLIDQNATNIRSDIEKIHLNKGENT